MKKAIHISIIILFLIAACVTEQILTKTYFQKTKDYVLFLKTISSEVEDISAQEIKEKTNELEKYWEEKESIICTFVNHKEIEEIGVEINKLKTSINENKKDEFIESLNLIIFYLDGYSHVVGINLQSIF